MVKFTFGNTNADWTNKLTCSIGTCGIGVSEATTSLDNSKIYNFFIYGSTTFLYFATLNFTDGAVVGSRYVSSQVCTHVYGVALSGNYLAANTACASYYLVLYNIPSASFVLKIFLLDYLYGITIEPTSGRFIDFGAALTLSYATKFSAEYIDIHQDFNPSIVLSMSALSPAIDQITSYTGAASNIASQTCSVTIPGTQSVSFMLTSSTTSDVKFQISDQSFSVIENNVLTVTPDLTCSSAGSTSITYSIANCVGSTAPTWAIINSSTGLLTCTPPDVSVDADFCMFILSTVVGVSSPIQKKITVTVINCIALNCKTCSDLSSSVCSQCVLGYSLSSGICTVASSSQTSGNGSSSKGNSSTSTTNSETKETAEVLKTSSQSIVGANAVIITFTGIMNISSMSSLWSMINQIQMFFLLILTRAFIPEDIQVVITGSSFALNPSKYLPFTKMGIYESVVDNFNFGLSNSLLEPLEIKSDSIVYNNTTNVILLFLISIFHLTIYLLRRCLLNCNTDGKCSCFIKKTTKLLNKLFEIMTFGYYIRFILELHQYLLISSNSEVYLFNTSSSLKIISLAISFITLILCIGLIFTPIYMVFSSFRLEVNQHNKFGEFFNGFKSHKKYKLYLTILLLRRIVFVIFLISLVSIPSNLLIGLLSVLQLIYLIYTTILRPYEEVKANMIEIINELYFFLLFGSLLHLNKESDWNITSTLIYMWVLSSNSMVLFLIIVIHSIRNAAIWIYKKCTSSQQNTGIDTQKVLPKTSSKAKHNKLDEESKSQSNFESTPNPSTKPVHEENKYDFYDENSNIQMRRVKGRF